MATAALVLGIVAIVSSFIPVLGAIIAVPCGIVGAILGVVVLARGSEEAKGKPVAGLVLSIAGVVVAIAWSSFVASAVEESGVLEELDDPAALQEQLEDLSETASGDAGREFMMAQSCTDVMIEYNTMRELGHDNAVLHVSNVYNMKSSAFTYIAASDAAAKIRQCQSQ